MFWLTITRALALVLALVVGPASAQMTLRGVGGTRGATSVATNFLLINTGSALLINTGSKFLIK